MHAYTLTGATLRDAVRLGVLPGHRTQKGIVDTLDTPSCAIAVNDSARVKALLKRLRKSNCTLSRRQLATSLNCSKPTVTRTIKPLVESGRVYQTLDMSGLWPEYRYRLVRQSSLVIRRKDGVLARYCDCGKYVRFRRHKGTYIFNCRACGVRYFDDNPMGGE